MNQGLPSNGVLAVVVAYRPDREEFKALMEALAPQVQAVLVVDNTPADEDSVAAMLDPMLPSMPHVRHARMGINVGIAAAQNLGIHMALEEGFEFILFSDQDSVPEPAMVERLLSVIRTLAGKGVRTACVCPAYTNSGSDRLNRFQVHHAGHVFHSSVDAAEAVPFMEVVTAISSGSLMPASVFRDVGLMCEGYFVDFVDTEWCLRARNQGYAIYGTALARMRHCEGGARFRVWYGRWTTFAEYSPSRLKGRFRNAVWLLRSAHVPMRWKLRSSWTWLGDAYAHLLFGRDRLRKLAAIVGGIRLGLHGAVGHPT